MDASFAKKLKDGDRAAWLSFFEEHQVDVYGYVRKLSGADEEYVDELFQDVWLGALKSISSFDSSRGDLRMWLFGVARNRVALHWRQRARVPAQLTYDGFELLASKTSSPHSIASRAEEKQVLEACLLMLPVAQREVILLRYMFGLSLQEIASSRGVSVKAIESMLARIRKSLKSILLQHSWSIVGDEQ